MKKTLAIIGAYLLSFLVMGVAIAMLVIVFLESPLAFILAIIISAIIIFGLWGVCYLVDEE